MNGTKGFQIVGEITRTQKKEMIEIKLIIDEKKIYPFEFYGNRMEVLIKKKDLLKNSQTLTDEEIEEHCTKCISENSGRCMTCIIKKLRGD